MPMFVALLRGVNVGKANRVPMAELRALLADLGYTRLATLLNSGNAAFHARRGTPASHAKAIAAALAGRLKVQVPVVVKSAKELDAIIDANPIAADDSLYPRLLVAFVQDAKRLTNLAVIGSLVVAPERFERGSQAAYLFCARGILESKAAAALLGKAGGAATSRNWATALKLQALANEHVAD
jgi:uncharacterized protein (DUF1697 family)